jgi:putative acetyltransferase
VTGALIREALPADAERIVAIHAAAVRGLRGRDPYGDAEIEAWSQIRSPDDLRELMATRRFVVADGSDGLLAYAVLDPEAATLRSVYVHPRAQGRGLGRRLVQDALAAAQKAGITHLELDAAPTSVSFYEGLGFAVLGDSEHRFRCGTRMTCVRMAQDLGGGPGE